MICDKFENIELYCKEGDALHKAIVWARDFDLSIADGVHEIEEKDIFAKVGGYETQPVELRKFENHRDYIDVQVILAGEECMDVSLEEGLEPLGDYNEADDVTKIKAPEMFSPLAMKPGMFAVFFPQDAHRPNCNLNGISKNRKICMKVRV